MAYISTRGQAPKLSFEEVVLAGLASDGGLYLPEALPHFSTHELSRMAGMSYTELAYTIIHPFVEGAVSDAQLKKIIEESYAGFAHKAVAPLKQLSTNEWLLELFHGPTLAFKDFALQFLGRLVDALLEKRNEKVVVLGATSGDTGSAAIAGCRGRSRMQIFILHPHERTSLVQRRQMTTVADANVHNIALQGTFDDCQDIVKALFGDESFRGVHHLVAVNSINWARILAQVVYYFYAAFAVGSPARTVSFCVPTGNFGDIFAGYLARKMGLPVHKLIIATNKNDILNRCLKTGVYGMDGVSPTLSPSMDIQISSNFERLLFDLYDRDGNQVRELMQKFRAEKKLSLSASAHQQFQTLFDSGSADDETTKTTIKSVFEQTGEVLDPHTAVGVHVGRTRHADASIPLIHLATAHPAKFPDAVKASCGISPALPPHMADLFERRERFDVLPNDVKEIAAYIARKKA